MDDRKTWNQRIEECKGILEILLDTEFKPIKKTVHFLIFYEPDKNKKPVAYAQNRLSYSDSETLKYPVSVKNHSLIKFPSTTWERWPDLNSHDIENLMRHELLHLELPKLTDEDDEWKVETRKRGIILSFEKSQPDLIKELAWNITRALWSKIKSGELKIIDSSKPKSLTIKIVDNSPKDIKEELRLYAEKAVKRALQNWNTQQIREAISQRQKIELNKILGVNNG